MKKTIRTVEMTWETREVSTVKQYWSERSSGVGQQDADSGPSEIDDGTTVDSANLEPENGANHEQGS